MTDGATHSWGDRLGANPIVTGNGVVILGNEHAAGQGYRACSLAVQDCPVLLGTLPVDDDALASPVTSDDGLL